MHDAFHISLVLVCRLQIHFHIEQGSIVKITFCRHHAYSLHGTLSSDPLSWQSRRSFSALYWVGMMIQSQLISFFLIITNYIILPIRKIYRYLASLLSVGQYNALFVSISIPDCPFSCVHIMKFKKLQPKRTCVHSDTDQPEACQPSPHW